MSDQNSQLALVDAPADKPVRLLSKQRLFINFYLGDANFNASKAARMAGYADRCASSMGASNLRKPRIVREIERRLDLMGLSAAEVKGRLGQMARGEIPTKTITKGSETTKIFDERQALENVARIHGMFVDRHELRALPGLDIIDAPDE